MPLAFIAANSEGPPSGLLVIVIVIIFILGSAVKGALKRAKENQERLRTGGTARRERVPRPQDIFGIETADEEQAVVLEMEVPRPQRAPVKKPAQPPLQQPPSQKAPAQPSRQPPSPVEAVPRAEPSQMWIERLPADPLKRAIILHELLGPPLAMRRSRRK